MFALYLVPVVTVQGPKGPVLRPKYLSSTFPSSQQWTMLEYGLEPVCLLAFDGTTAEHTTLAANADVYSFGDLAQNIGGSGATALKNYAEALNIPTNWVTGSMNRLAVARVIAQVFQFSLRVKAIGATRLFPTGVTLNTQWQNLPQNYRELMLTSAESLGWSTASMTGSTTMRNILRALADEWGSEPILLGGMTL